MRGRCQVLLKYEKEKEKAAFKKMTFKEKAGHIVMYYRYHIMIGIAVIAILAWALNHYVINPPKKSSLTLLFHTSIMDSDKVDDAQTALNEAFPELCTEDKEIQITTLATATGGDPQVEYATVMKAMAMVSAKELDLIVADKETGLQAVASEYLRPLDEVFTEEEMVRLRELADQQVQVDGDEGEEEKEPGIVEAELVTTDIDTDEEIRSGPYPFLINISNNETIREIFYGQDIYVGIVTNATNVEAAKEMIWYLLSSPN